jgi:hypothetical protein
VSRELSAGSVLLLRGKDYPMVGAPLDDSVQHPDLQRDPQAQALIIVVLAGTPTG